MTGIALLLIALAGETTLNSDAHRFPQTAQEAERKWKAAQKHYEWIYTNRSWDFAWVADSDWRRSCWSTLDDVKRCSVNDPPAQRRHLARLKELIGADYYDWGMMPDNLPTYRFVNRDYP